MMAHRYIRCIIKPLKMKEHNRNAGYFTGESTANEGS